MALKIDSIFPPPDERDEPYSNADILTELDNLGIIVKSIKFYSANVAAASYDQPITSVDLSSSIVLRLGGSLSLSAGSAKFRDVHHSLQFVTASSVRMTKGLNNSALYYSFAVLEFEPKFIKRITYGSIPMSNSTSATVTFPAVDTTKTLLIYNGSSNNVATEDIDNLMFIETRIALTNSTTVTCYKNTANATYTTTTLFTMVEFN